MKLKSYYSLVILVVFFLIACSPGNNEKEWISLFNGKVVFRAINSSQIIDGEKVPLIKGKIQLQSEGAEIFYKDIEIKFL
jgi:hypothetical protein